METVLQTLKESLRAAYHHLVPVLVCSIGMALLLLLALLSLLSTAGFIFLYFGIFMLYLNFATANVVASTIDEL